MDKLSTNETIRQPPEPQQNVEPEDTESGNARDNETDPPSGNDEHQPEHSLLETDVSRQSRGLAGW